MKRFITTMGILTEDRVGYEKPSTLKPLEMAAKEVKSRHDCVCSGCDKPIRAGERVLKVIQKHGNGQYTKVTNCGGCYSIDSQTQGMYY